MGGIIPCYSTVTNYLTPPPNPSATPITISGTPVTVTSTIVNVVFARNYPVARSSGLTTSGKAGVGVGAGIAALGLVGFGLLLLRRWRKKRDSTVYPPAFHGPEYMSSTPSGGLSP